MKLPKLPQIPAHKFALTKSLAEIPRPRVPKISLPRQLTSLRKPDITLPRSLPRLPKAWPVAAPGTPPSPDAPKASTPLWRAITKPAGIVNWRVVTAALFGIGILHILATLAAPQLAIATAFDRLKRVLPANRMIILPPIAPGAQPLPFLSPALRYAMCRFETANGPVDLSVELRETGSSLTIYSPHGESIYTAAQSEVALHRVRIIPADGRFMGLTPEARGRQSDDVPSATLEATRGIIVYAVPNRGASYRNAAEAQLSRATCLPAVAPSN